MELSKADATALVGKLDSSLLAHQISAAERDRTTAVLTKLASALSSPLSVQRLMTSKVLDALGSCLGALVSKRQVSDPSDDLLFHVCDALKRLIHNHKADPRIAVSDVALGSLATLALHQDQHDGEAIEVGLSLLAALFSQPESAKQVRHRFFGRGGQEMDATATACSQLVKNAERVLAESQTHAAQMSMCDTLVRARPTHPLPAALSVAHRRAEMKERAAPHSRVPVARAHSCARYADAPRLVWQPVHQTPLRTAPPHGPRCSQERRQFCHARRRAAAQLQRQLQDSCYVGDIAKGVRARCVTLRCPRARRAEA